MGEINNKVTKEQRAWGKLRMRRTKRKKMIGGAWRTRPLAIGGAMGIVVRVGRPDILNL
jgi:hypothetical protein